MEKERKIIHMDLDSFFVSVERLTNPNLIGKPIIIGGISDRGVVASCSYEARAFGVHSAMPSRLARQLCPHAIFIRGDMDSYSKQSNIVTEIIEGCTPVVEKASIDEHYLDISGMDRLIKHSGLWAHELKERIKKETGLPISFGLSVNKTVSKIATSESKPNGELSIETGTEKIFLSPLSVKKIPGVGGKTFEMLSRMNIAKIATVQEMPIEVMTRLLGENGQTIWKKAQGIDNTPVEPYSEQKSMSKETTFDADTIDMVLLNNTLISMVDSLAFELRTMKKVTGCVTIKIKYSNFDTHTYAATIPFTANDDAIIEKVKELFEKNYSRRMLIRLIGVKFTKLVSGFNQINLFTDTEEKANLYQVIDKLRVRYGYDAILKGISLKDKKHDT